MNSIDIAIAIISAVGALFIGRDFYLFLKFMKKKKAWENLHLTNESGDSVPSRPRVKHRNRLQCSDE